MEDQRILSVAEVADRWDCAEKTVRERLRSGALRGFKLGNNTAPWRVSLKRVEEYEQRREAEAFCGKSRS